MKREKKPKQTSYTIIDTDGTPHPALREEYLIGQVLAGLVGWHKSPEEVTQDEIDRNVDIALRYARGVANKRRGEP